MKPRGFFQTILNSLVDLFCFRRPDSTLEFISWYVLIYAYSWLWFRLYCWRRIHMRSLLSGYVLLPCVQKKIRGFAKFTERVFFSFSLNFLNSLKPPLYRIPFTIPNVQACSLIYKVHPTVSNFMTCIITGNRWILLILRCNFDFSGRPFFLTEFPKPSRPHHPLSVPFPSQPRPPIMFMHYQMFGLSSIVTENASFMLFQQTGTFKIFLPGRLTEIWWEKEVLCDFT